MLTISKPLSATQAQTYHAAEFTNAEQNYYTQPDQIRGEWQGKLAQAWNLTGDVKAEQFEKLAQGFHPETGAELVRQREGYSYKNERGELVKVMEHRAGWDATFSAPKSVSLTALVGADERVREAHRESVRLALSELESYVQARIGGNHTPETTGKWIVAKFEHDSARPVNGYAAPQLHTHCVFFNVTEVAGGETRALQPQELYRSQRYATAVYQSELASRLTHLGYELVLGKNGAPEIKGYSREYIEASSPRRQQIEAHLKEQGLAGAGPAEIAAHRTREAKQKLTAEEMLARHLELAARFGNQAEQVVVEARERRLGQELMSGEEAKKYAQQAVTYARDRQIEREAVFNERDFLNDALRRSMAGATLKQIRQNFEARLTAGEFVDRGPSGAGWSYTTRQMLEIERANIAFMQHGQGMFRDPLAREHVQEQVEERLRRLSDDQRRAVREILASHDQVVGLQGSAGAGKTTALAAIREATERQGYEVEGFAPTSRAAQQLETAGIRSKTLQKFLAQGEQLDGGIRRLYFVDESSLASSKQVNEFFRLLHDFDRVILVGDTRQHQGVEAGRPFEQLQNVGMQTSRLDHIIRQRDPELKRVVEQLADGQVREAINCLAQLGRVRELRDPDARLNAIAQDYARQPDGALVVSPDNRSRMALNERIHHELQAKGAVSREEHQVNVLLPDNYLTGADREWAGRYEPGHVVRFTKGSQALKLKAGEYVRVTDSDPGTNLVTVKRVNGRTVSYDPRRLQGVTVYQEVYRSFAVGDRIQFTAPYRDKRIANRELGTIKELRSNGMLSIQLDSGRTVEFSMRKHPHIDYGYALTSHSSQGVTADRVLINVDTWQAHEKLLNSRFAYVSISRARYEAKIYTDNAQAIGVELSRQVSKRAAIEHDHGQTQTQRKQPAHQQSHDFGLSP
ncbi:MAG TPA: MobF family relaxase [Terriglobia bacterium]|nr:MobF family relaxase [Terriglobia bacterium]